MVQLQEKSPSLKPHGGRLRPVLSAKAGGFFQDAKVGQAVAERREYALARVQQLAVSDQVGPAVRAWCAALLQYRELLVTLRALIAEHKGAPPAGGAC